MADAKQIEDARNAAMDAGSMDVVAELVSNDVFDYDELISMLAQQ